MSVQLRPASIVIYGCLVGRLGAILSLEGVYLLFYSTTRRYRKNINRRLKLIDRTRPTARASWCSCARERGLTAAGDYRLPIVNRSTG